MKFPLLFNNIDLIRNKIVRLFFVFIISVFVLSGCETSSVWYVTHPDKKTIAIDGEEFYVVPRGSNQFDVWGGAASTNINMSLKKRLQIKAVEEVSGCKVIGAEYLPGSAMLQTEVSCNR